MGRSKFLFAKYRKPFLQRQLEPVPAGDAIAGPVVQIFVGYHRLNHHMVFISRGLRVSQNTFGVEDVQTLVLHGPHIEGARDHNHVQIEVVFATVNRFVEAHCVLQRGHRMRKLPFQPRVTPELNSHIPP